MTGPPARCCQHSRREGAAVPMDMTRPVQSEISDFMGRVRQDSATADLSGQLATVNGKLQQLNTQLAQVNAQLANLAKSASPTKANLENQRNTIAGQINTLTGRANQLATTMVSAGKIIRDADLPARPSKPDVPLNLASGAMVGLLLGIGGGLLRERLD